MSLHQRLIDDAAASKTRDMTMLLFEEHIAWNDAVGVYRSAGRRGNQTFARPMLITTDALTQAADDATEPAIDAPLRAPLMRAAPIYRRYW